MSDLNLDFCYMTATEAIAAFKTRALSPVELLKAVIARCEQLEPKLNAFTYTYFDRALEQAKAARDLKRWEIQRICITKEAEHERK